MLFKLNSKEITANTYIKETTMKRHKKVLFEQIKEEQQSKRKKRNLLRHTTLQQMLFGIS